MNGNAFFLSAMEKVFVCIKNMLTSVTLFYKDYFLLYKTLRMQNDAHVMCSVLFLLRILSVNKKTLQTYIILYIQTY